MANFHTRPKNGMIVLGERNSNMGRFASIPRSVRAQLLQRHLAQRFASSLNSQTDKIPRGFHQSAGNPVPMTIELQGPRAKLHGSMEAFPPSPDLYHIESDHTLPTSDLGTYAASPNSLYMYEQEKNDMQHSMVSSLCSPNVSNNTLQLKEEFDLKPQYENSNLDLSVAGSPANTDTIHGKLWSTSFDPEASSDSSLFPMDGSGLASGPTLTELNMLNMDDSSLMEEVWSLVSNDSSFDPSVLCSKRDSPLAKVSCVQSTKVQRPSDQPNSSLTLLLSNQIPKSQPPVTNLHPQNVKIPSRCVSQMSSSFSATSPSWTMTPSTSRSLTITPSSSRSMTVAPSSSRSMTVAPSSSRSVSHTVISSQPLMEKTVIKKEGGLHGDDKLTLCKLLQRKPLPSQSLPIQPLPLLNTGMKRSATVAKMDDENVEEKWKEIEKYINEPMQEDTKSSTSSRGKRSRHDSGSSAQTSHEDQESDNDVFSDQDSDLDDDLSDEEGTLLSPLEENLTGNGKRKERQFFWQYNVQSKGPKGTRLRLEVNSADPHQLKEFEDPVFDPNNTYVAGIRHGGKARKGDGNDVHPNPKRLVQIGMQIKRLNRKINEVTAMGEGTAAARSHSRKEKNKLASRACRLKKKAQHEANKVKLFGLESEHKQLMEVMVSIKAELKRHLLERGETTPKKSLVEELERLIKVHLKEMIAGNTTDYVNKVIAAYESGDPRGGLDIRK